MGSRKKECVLLTQEYLKQILSYNPDTGIWVWQKSLALQIKIGQQAGTILKSGYRHIRINYKHYKAYRLAWLYMTGEWPKEQIDHINGIKDDNRWCNLREATTQQNGWNSKKPKNNTSGYKGISWNKKSKKWTVFIQVNKKNKYLGGYETKKEAIQIRKEATAKYHGEFARFA